MTLFHYCSNDTFINILDSQQVWACEMSLANDSLEGKWVHKLATEYEGINALGGVQQETYRNQFEAITDLMGAAALCFSEHSDSLSQWRGYADDGRGVSIGFSELWLREIEKKNSDRENGGRLIQIEYDHAKQLDLLRPICDKVIEILKTDHLVDPTLSLVGAEPSPARLEEHKKAIKSIAGAFMTLLPSMHLVKNPAFAEEKEWRFIFPVITKMPNAYGGFQFTARRDGIVPYKPLNFENYTATPISTVILGPKNITPIMIVEAALKHHGFPDVSVIRSTASYR